MDIWIENIPKDSNTSTLDVVVIKLKTPGF
jgi:hypothetical protein